ncbi:unnamed protein product [Prunus armeniaca]|uniref:Uncharacterized protein n=1 Tax=Prunus armeniaca TaxID=36596 RepID=A0A6J5WJD5_PRUAR|nr:unnamed protein product [Prunus armeniaca]
MVTAMSTRLSPISNSELHSLLVSHEIRLQEQATYSTILPSANMVYKGQNSNNTRAPASPHFHNHRSQSISTTDHIKTTTGPFIPAYSNSDFNTWFPNTGATHHITPDLANLSITNNYNGLDQLTVGNGPAHGETSTSRAE